MRRLNKVSGEVFAGFLLTLMAMLSPAGSAAACARPTPGDPRVVNGQTLTSVATSQPIVLSALRMGLQPASQSGAASDAETQSREHWERGYSLASSGNLEEAAVELRRAVDLAPGNPQYVYTLGIVLAKQGKLEEAVGYFRRASKLEPANMAVRQNLAAAEWQVGNLLDAERNLQAILKLKPNDQDASFLLGMVLENKGEYAKAAKLLAGEQDQLRQHPEAVAALLHSYYETSKPAEAHDLEDRLLKDPTQTQALFMGASMAEQAGDYSSAERMLKAVRDSYPSTGEVDYQLAVLRYRTGHYSEAEEILTRLANQSGETSKVFNLIGWCLAKQGKIQEAVKVFDRAIGLDPTKDSNYVDLATVLLDAGLLAPALEAANKAVEIDPHSLAAYRIRGQIQMRQHDYTAAVNSYTKAVEVMPNRGVAPEMDAAAQRALNEAIPATLLDLAEAQGASGQYENASATLEAAIKKYPRQAQFYYQYALIVLHHGDSNEATDHAKAAALLQKALTLDDSIAGAHYELGNLWLEQDQPAKALAELQRAAKLDPSRADTHYALWLVSRKLGRTQDAADEAQIFQKLKPLNSDTPH